MNQQTKKVLQAFAKCGKHFYGPVFRPDGAIVPLGIDLRPLLWYYPTFSVIVQSLAREVKKLNPQAVAGGLTGGAILAAAVSLIVKKPFVLVRKKPRGYSISRGVVEGESVKGRRVVLIDDSIVAGVMATKFVSSLKKAGFKVVGLVVAERVCVKIAKQWAKKNKVPVYYVVDYQQILDYFYQRGLIDKESYILTSAMTIDLYDWQKNKKLWNMFQARYKKFKKWRVAGK